jgi:hypothetical protein
VERRAAHVVLMGKHNGKRPLGGYRRRWEDIALDLQEIGWRG